MKHKFGLLLVLLSLTACSSAPQLKPDTVQSGDYTYLKSYLSWLIEQEMAQQDIEGLSIAVVDDQRVIWSQGFGYADTSKQLAATPETVYRVGSISKLFTDTLVMQLAEQGKLDIDKPLATYLPAFSIKSRFAASAAITPRNLMTHHSGLPGDVGNGMWTEKPAPFGQVVGQLKDEYMAYPPDTINAYSNLGITLLGAMLEQLTAKSFDRYADEQLLKPLGMANASFSSGLDGNLMSKAYKHHQELRELPLRDTPAGGLNANVLDMSRFIEMVLADGLANGRQILKPETLKAMLHQQNLDVALDFDLKSGLGWFLDDKLQIGTIAEHGGATLYHTSLLSVLPAHKLGVVTLTNSRPQGRSLQKINETALKLAAALKAGQGPDLDKDQPEPATRPLTQQEQENLAGQYATALGYVNLQKQGDALVTEIKESSLDLVRRADGKAGVRYLLMGLIPIQPDELAEIGFSVTSRAGHEVALVHTHDRAFVIGEKIKPAPIPEHWQKQLGEYEIINLAQGEGMIPEKCALRERDGFLMLEYSIPAFDMNNLAFPIEPVSDHEAIILGLGRGMRETVRLVNVDGQERIAYSGYLLRKKSTMEP